MLQKVNHIPSTKGLDFVKSFESFVPYVYDDLRSPIRVNGKMQYREWKRGDPIRGTLTIGYGHTDAAKYKLGFKLKDAPAGFRITEEKASEILDVDLDECEQQVNELVKVPITQGQFDALLSFTFNCGAGNLRSLIVPLNKGDYTGTRRKFDLYTRSKGKVLRGLQRRRDGEQALWDDGDTYLPTEIVHHGADVDAPGTIDGKPATAADLRPYSRKLTVADQGKKGTGLLGVGLLAKIFTDTVNQAKGVSDAFDLVSTNATLLIVLAIALAGVVVFALIERWTIDDFFNGRWFLGGADEPDDLPVDDGIDDGPAEPVSA